MPVDPYDLPNVIHLPPGPGQRAPRHRLLNNTTAAKCGRCDRLVLRWSAMGDHDRNFYAASIRAQMSPGIWARLREEVS